MTKKQAKNRAPVMLRGETHALAAELRDELTSRSGARHTMADAIHRGLMCLKDAHERGAWLSPQEAAPVMEQRARDRMVSVLAQFIGRAMPEKKLKGIAFATANETMTIEFVDGDSFPILLAGVESTRPTAH